MKILLIIKKGLLCSEFLSYNIKQTKRYATGGVVNIIFQFLSIDHTVRQHLYFTSSCCSSLLLTGLVLQLGVKPRQAHCSHPILSCSPQIIISQHNSMFGQNVIIMRQRGRRNNLFIPKEKQQLNKINRNKVEGGKVYKRNSLFTQILQKT